MNRFDYVRATGLGAAVQAGCGEHVAYLAGGTNLIDLMKEHVAQPLKLVDINALPLREIGEESGTRATSPRAASRPGWPPPSTSSPAAARGPSSSPTPASSRATSPSPPGTPTPR